MPKVTDSPDFLKNKKHKVNVSVIIENPTVEIGKYVKANLNCVSCRKEAAKAYANQSSRSKYVQKQQRKIRHVDTRERSMKLCLNYFI